MSFMSLFQKKNIFVISSKGSLRILVVKSATNLGQEGIGRSRSCQNPGKSEFMNVVGEAKN